MQRCPSFTKEQSMYVYRADNARRLQKAHRARANARIRLVGIALIDLVLMGLGLAVAIRLNNPGIALMAMVVSIAFTVGGYVHLYHRPKTDFMRHLAAGTISRMRSPTRWTRCAPRTLLTRDLKG